MMMKYFVSKLASVKNVNALSKRTFLGLLNSISNKPDEERIKMLGPDRSCAEWLLRNGAFIKWAGSKKFLTDYNSLPGEDNKEAHFIEEINVDEAGIMQVGFRHFEGCNHIKRIRFHHCPYLTDEALADAIDKLKHSVTHLELTSCGDISDAGLSYVTNLRLLKSLLLKDLPEVRNPQKAFDHLKASLPECVINYVDLKRIQE